MVVRLTQVDEFHEVQVGELLPNHGESMHVPSGPDELIHQEHDALPIRFHHPCIQDGMKGTLPRRLASL